ncbi:tungstate ABC transporter substrate-binding protein WtpA [Desulfurococcaceae archaeon MEX13E-LK6-19]|nr:tungstate ABC transporter substrate-binding protein WtpA [Desulfurococcaceae archaeon MEX13E-LK6-19]
MLIIAIAIALIAGIAIAYFMWFMGEEKTLKIFCAGSLRIPLQKLAAIYEKEYGVKVHIEASGSVEAVRKITDLGKTADVLAVADYTLIKKYMIPDYASWYVVFATNEVVLAFTNTSKYADELREHPDKWYEILAREDVKWGFSDPNKDPCGYRSVAVIVLASMYYNDPSILGLITNKTNIKVEISNNTAIVTVPANLQVYADDLMIRPKSVDLISLLESGVLDYAFEYKSVAVQHNLSYIELPKEINLSDPSLEQVYNRVTVKILVGTDDERSILIKTITYGATIPLNAENRDLAIKFIKLLLSDTGREIFNSLGQPFLEKPIFYGDVPEELKG